jgi:hypothetical protein
MASFRRNILGRYLPASSCSEISSGDRALLAKSVLLNRRGVAVRATSQTDVELGLHEYVQFYFCRRSTQSTDVLIIRSTNSRHRRSAAVSSSGLGDCDSRTDRPECTLCLWNAAIGRPAVGGHCRGGNWSRGTAPRRILEHFARLVRIHTARADIGMEHSIADACGDQIRRALPMVRHAPGVPELPLKSPVSLRDRFTLSAFSDDDLQVVHLLPTLSDADTLNTRIHSLPGCDCTAQCAFKWRTMIAAYFSGRALFQQNWTSTGKGDRIPTECVDAG